MRPGPGLGGSVSDRTYGQVQKRPGKELAWECEGVGLGVASLL